MTPDSSTPWYRDRGEIDRFIDRELDPAEQARRAAELAEERARDPGGEVVRAVEARRALAGAVARAAALESREAGDVLEPLTRRVRLSLGLDGRGAATSPRPPDRRGGFVRLAPWAVAAACLLGLVFVLARPSSRPSLSAGGELAMLEWRGGGAPAARHGPEDGEWPGRTDWAPLRDGELGVSHWHAAPGDTDSVGEFAARLFHPGDGAPVGFALHRDPTATAEPDVGVQRVEDAIVLDQTVEGARLHVAISRERVERLGICRACHTTAREGRVSPHRLVDRPTVAEWR